MIAVPDLPAWLTAILVSPIVGSFVGVLVRRLPEGKAVGLARSKCESCRRTLTVADLIPILSFLMLKGCCRTCRAPVAPFHLAIELAAIAVAIWAAVADPHPARLWVNCLLGWTLLALAWIDAEHMRLPDALTLPLLAGGLATQALLAPERLPDCMLGAIAGYASFRGVALAYRAFRRRDGLGAGDAKLLAAAGAWIGWAALPKLVLLAALLGIGTVVVMRMRGSAVSGHTAMSFGPHLAAAFWLVHLQGPISLEPLM